MDKLPPTLKAWGQMWSPIGEPALCLEGPALTVFAGCECTSPRSFNRHTHAPHDWYMLCSFDSYCFSCASVFMSWQCHDLHALRYLFCSPSHYTDRIFPFPCTVSSLNTSHQKWAILRGLQDSQHLSVGITRNIVSMCLGSVPCYFSFLCQGHTPGQSCTGTWLQFFNQRSLFFSSPHLQPKIII